MTNAKSRRATKILRELNTDVTFDVNLGVFQFKLPLVFKTPSLYCIRRSGLYHTEILCSQYVYR